MASSRLRTSLTRVQPFFEALLSRDASGSTWLPQLLAATPHGRERLGELVERPGYLLTPLAVRTVSGHLGCFEYPAPPTRELLTWFIDHPEELSWPPDYELTREARVLRRALLHDDPAGSREKAQERAREAVATRSPMHRQWWRFEGITRLDCVLVTDKVLLTIEAKRDEDFVPSTEWYPQRSRLVRTIEAAKQLAEERQWASLLLSDRPRSEGSDEHVARLLAEGAPHVSESERAELQASYLGNLTWAEASSAVGLSWNELLEPSVHDSPRRARARAPGGRTSRRA